MGGHGQSKTENFCKCWTGQYALCNEYMQELHLSKVADQMLIDLLCNLIKGVIEPHKGQRIGDCFQTMWVLCFPNSAAIVPPTFHSTIYPLPIFPSLVLFFSTNISESQCFQTKHRTRRRKLKKSPVALGGRRVSRKMDFTLSTLPDHPPQEFTVTEVAIVDEENQSPAFQFHTLEAWGPPGAPARLPQFDWFVSRWLAVRPNRHPVKIPAAVVFHRLPATALPSPTHHRLSASWNHFQLSSESALLFVEIANNQAPRNRGTWDKWMLWWSMVQLC